MTDEMRDAFLAVAKEFRQIAEKYLRSRSADPDEWHALARGEMTKDIPQIGTLARYARIVPLDIQSAAKVVRLCHLVRDCVTAPEPPPYVECLRLLVFIGQESHEAQALSANLAVPMFASPMTASDSIKHVLRLEAHFERVLTTDRARNRRITETKRHKRAVGPQAQRDEALAKIATGLIGNGGVNERELVKRVSLAADRAKLWSKYPVGRSENGVGIRRLRAILKERQVL